MQNLLIIFFSLIFYWLKYRCIMFLFREYAKLNVLLSCVYKPKTIIKIKWKEYTIISITNWKQHNYSLLTSNEQIYARENGIFRKTYKPYSYIYVKTFLNNDLHKLNLYLLIIIWEIRGNNLFLSLQELSLLSSSNTIRYSFWPTTLALQATASVRPAH